MKVDKPKGFIETSINMYGEGIVSQYNKLLEESVEKSSDIGIIRDNVAPNSPSPLYRSKMIIHIDSIEPYFYEDREFGDDPSTKGITITTVDGRRFILNESLESFMVKYTEAIEQMKETIEYEFVIEGEEEKEE